MTEDTILIFLSGFAFGIGAVLWIKLYYDR